MTKMDKIEKMRELGKGISEKLRLPTDPVAVKFIENPNEEIPDEVFRPSKAGKKMTLCQGFTMARRDGGNVGFTMEDNVCVASSLAHGWGEVEDEEMLKSQEIAGYHADAEAEAEIGLKRKWMPSGKFEGMLISPLNQTIAEPHVVLIYGNPGHMHHLIAALTYEGRVINSNFYSTGESCIKGLIETYLTGEPQVVIPGLGDRVNSAAGENEMCMGIPADLLEETNDNLLTSVWELVGKPISSLLPEVPEDLTPAWPYLRKKLSEGEEKQENSQS